MLDTLKRYASGWVAQLLIALLVLSFAVWGVADIFTGFGANSIARVGSTEVSLVEFQRRYDLALQNLNRQLGQNLTPQQAVQFGVPNQVVSQLVTEATLDEAASELGLGLSNEMLGQEIARDPQLVGPTGTFSRAYLTQIIGAMRMTEDEFIIDRRKLYTRDQLIDALSGGLAAPDAYMQAFHQYSSEERAISYVVVAAPPETDIPTPSESELADYFAAHQVDWRAPEFRAIQYFTLTPEQIADPSEVSDDDVRRRYDAQPARFSTPERRQVEQIVFRDRADADAAAAALDSGKSFADLVAERELTPTDISLGLITRDRIVDPAVADAAFSLPQDGVSPIVDGRFGPVIVHVTKIEPAETTTFEEAKADLKQEIANQLAADAILDLHDAIEDARAGGAPLAEIAREYDLGLVTVPAVDSTGKDPNDQTVEGLPAGLLEAAVQTDVDLENDPLEPDRSTFVWYTVTDITPPRDRSLADIRDRVAAAWMDDQRAGQLDVETETIRNRLASGESIVAVATDMSLNVNGTSVTRRTPPRDDLSTDVIQAAFTGPKGTIAVANGAEPMTKVVLVVDEVTTPPFFSGAPDQAQVANQINSQISNDLMTTYAAGLGQRTEVRLNQVALQQALGVSPN